jgi:DNA-binding response OmpR family regulator
MKRTVPKKILLVQGSASDMLGVLLEQQGYDIAWVHSGKGAIELLEQEQPHLVIVDAPSLRGSTDKLCSTIKRTSSTPMLLIGSDDVKQQTIEANEAEDCGAAYLPRPIQSRKLIAKIEKLIPEGHSAEMRFADIVFQPATGKLRRGSHESYLNPKLSQLLQLFMQHPGELITRKMLMHDIWDTTFMGDTRTLDVHMRWLREAIEDNPATPQYLRTVRGQGYRFDIPKSKK